MKRKIYFDKSSENLANPLCSKVMQVFYPTRALSLCKLGYLWSKLKAKVKVDKLIGHVGTACLKR